MNNLANKRAILYRRVSTTDQKETGGSLNHQRDALREFCKRYSIEVVKEYEEDHSAKTFDRPQFQELLRFAKKNKSQIDYVLVASWDRFSRDGTGSLNYIQVFRSLGIEVNCINNWIDHEDANQLLMLHIHVAIPEVENRIKSKRVRNGIYQALLEGRWINKQPKGYLKGRDEHNKPLMKPDPEIAPLINSLFNEFSLGAKSQNELLKDPSYRKLKLKRSSLSRILTSIVYTGKIVVPEYDGEPERIVQGLHEPIVEWEVFEKVQKVLKCRSRYKQKSKTLNDNLPLRGFLKCPKCGGNLTGSASKSKTGAKHYYYHCNPKKGCNIRFRIKDAHDKFEQLLDEITPNKAICDLFEKIVEDKYAGAEKTKLVELKEVEKDITKIETRQDSLLNKLVDGVISDEDFKKTNSRYKMELSDLIERKQYLENDQSELKELVKFGNIVLKNLKVFFTESSTKTKQKLLSSILEEKLVLTNKKYRTPKFKAGFNYIFSVHGDLQRKKKKRGGLHSKDSSSVLGAGLAPIRLIQY